MSQSKTPALQCNSYQSVFYGDDGTDISAKIFEWAQQGNKAALEKHSAHLGVRDKANASPLHYATSGGHLGIIQLIVEVSGPDGLNSSDDEGNTALHWAVQGSQTESCGCLLNLGADPNILNQGLMSPLHLAISLRHNNLVELLLSHSATDVNLEGELGNGPVILACSIDNHEALRFLFKYGARLCQQNKLGHYPIHAAAFAGSCKCMQVVLQRGEELGRNSDVQINYVDKSYCSPLHLAVRGGNLEVIRLCIEQGARVDQQQCDKSTPLHFACIQGATAAVQLMLSTYGTVCDVINITDGACQTPLHKSTIFDHVELAEYLISKGADINFVDCKGHTPLLLATSSGAWRTVALLIAHGANLKIKDKSGCNFLHLSILQPKGLKNLSAEVLQLGSVKELLGAEDIDGCTPLHYACRLGVPDSVNNMLGLNVPLDHKCKQKKSPLHFAAEYGRINTCHRLLESMTDTRLLNEGDERGMTPLHLASCSGHAKVVELLLKRGALFHSDYKGWTCLHHAAAEGYTKTMNTLLASNIKLIDKTDEDGNTAMHLAAKEGHSAAVLLLLDRGAKIALNKNDTSFLHEAVLSGRRDTADAIIQSERCSEAIEMFKMGSPRRCVIMDLIEFLPESYKTLLDTCVKESDDDVNSTNYHVQYDFRYLQVPMQFIKLAKVNHEFKFKPLVALNLMVEFHRIDLLTHPVCRKYLAMKWKAYGMKAHMLNLALYSLGMLPLTHLILNLRPVLNTTGNNTSVSMVTKSFDKQCYLVTTCMFLVLAMNLYAVGKEVAQIYQQSCRYFYDMSNIVDWSAAVSSLVFVIPLLLNYGGTWHWQAGALAVLLSWMNFLLYLQRFQRFGIYVVMFREIAHTLMSIISIFFYLILAFALSFYALMIDHNHFAELPLSLMQTFVMMVGEINYQDNFLKAYLRGSLPFPHLTYAIFIWFVLLVPILLMNLMIGLAVGDIAEVQKNALLKQIGMQIELHTSLEEKLPYWFMKRVDQKSVREYPNKACGNRLYSFMGMESEVGTLRHCTSPQYTPLERQISKQKYRLKEMSHVIEKQHNLLKLIVQKMEISSEAEDRDGPQRFGGGHRETPSGRTLSRVTSRWDALLKAVAARE